MNKKLRTIPDFECGFYIFGFVLCCLIYPIQSIAGEFDTYRYSLEKNNNNKVCSHMAEVYTKFFKKPFDITNYVAMYKENGSNLPPLLPGAKDDFRSFISMRFSFYPSSPEFNAIKWQVGKQMRGGTEQMHDVYPNIPFIAADMDIDNDGQLETVIKHEFIECYVPGCVYGHADVLSIFRKGDIDLMNGPIEWHAFFKAQNDHPPLAVIYGPQSTCDLVRPFIYDGVTYLSCYHQTWIKDYRNFHDETPDREYTDVLKYQGVGTLPGGRQPIKGETVCKFRMRVTK